MLRRTLPVLALLLAGCSSALTVGGVASGASQPAASQAAATKQVLAPRTVIDGIQVGSPIDCAAPVDCSAILSFAKTAATSTRGLVPGTIAGTSLYTPYVPANMFSTGGGYVVVYDLADGVQMAIRVHCGVGPCQVVPLQPLIDSLPTPSDYTNPS